MNTRGWKTGPANDAPPTKVIDLMPRRTGKDDDSRYWHARILVFAVMTMAAIGAIAFGEEVADWVFSHFSGVLD
jgi:hypothetical protein